MALLTDVITPRRGSHRRTLVLDSVAWRTTSSQVLSALGVHVGTIATAVELAARIDAEEPVRARERALRLLAYRERSAADLRARLSEDGYPETVADGVVADLVRIGIVDDERYAHALARLLTEVRGMGRSRALRELTTKGIEADVAQTALDESLPPQDERDAGLRLARALAARPKASVDRIATRLVRKGYPVATALSVAREALDAAGGAAAGDREALDADDRADLRGLAD